MERLSAQDEAFLLWERQATHMHVAATMIFDAAPLRTKEGGLDIGRIRAYVASRLYRIPRYRQRLVYPPLGGTPVWVDDEHFNVHYHVRHTSLPRPGSERQLKRLSGRIFSQQLDRSKPLWEFWVVEGLEGGERFAVITKVHHCVVDGVASVDLMTALMTPEPLDEFEEGPAFVPRPAPSVVDLVRDAAVWQATRPLRVLGGLARPGEQVGALVDRATRALRAGAEMLGTGIQGASDTPLNRRIGPHRRFDWLRMELSRVKAVKDRLGGTVNDVVLATATASVRRWLEERRVDLSRLRFRALAPVSVRTRDNEGTLGNRLSVWLVDLPIAEADPRERLAAIRRETTRLKERDRAIGADVLSEASEWTGSTLLSLGFQLVTRLRPFNLVVTNVPGPQVPLYLLDSRLRATYPQGPLFANQGLGMAQFSYDGWLCWGFNADWDLIPDLHRLVVRTDESFRELEEAAGIGPRARATATPSASPRRPRPPAQA
jgi:WS/DGAT/MGAT family acyltransferase